MKVGRPEGHQSRTRETFIVFWPHEMEGAETGCSA
jgi:hypothetical protein